MKVFIIGISGATGSRPIVVRSGVRIGNEFMMSIVICTAEIGGQMF